MRLSIYHNIYRAITRGWDQLHPKIKRYLISSLNTFLSVFLSVVGFALMQAQESPDIVFKSTFWVGVLAGAFVTAIRGVVKHLQESLNNKTF